MILDNQAIFSDQQAITASAVSTNVIDLGAMGSTSYNKTTLKRNLGKGPEIPLLIQVTEDFATLTSLTVALQQDDSDAFGSPTVVASQTIGVAQLKAGYIFPIDKVPRGVTERFLRLSYTVTGSNATTGKITAGFTTAVDGAYRG